MGYLSQEPQLDPAKDVKGDVLDGGGRPDLIDTYNAVTAKWSEPDADLEAIGAEQSALEDRINAVGAGTSAQRRHRDGRAPLPARRRRRHDALRR